MHSDIHLALHRLRATELTAELTAAHQSAPARPLPRTPLRTHVGWALVELGLRLAVPPARVTLAA
ncbi:hypothetical protein ABT034_26140 [Streptomyces sp. NPDC002773]|uniref:hypothetical protein n=1 Tax=Streptomyces sp. NPDC002773 TaxID=3154430 RepID=UPI003328B24E